MDERVLTERGGAPDMGDTAVAGQAESAAPVAVPAAVAPAPSAAPAVPAAAAAPAVPGAAAARPAALPAVPAPATPSSRWSQVPYAIVLAGMLAGLAWAWQGTSHVRAGMVTVAVAMLAAALGRLVLPERQAGMLATRHRLLDVAALLGLGVCLLVITIVLPRGA